MGHDAVEDMIVRLFRALPHGMAVTPQAVARRVARRLPKELLRSKEAARLLASTRGQDDWRELDGLGIQIENEAYEVLGEPEPKLITLADALVWGWQRHRHISPTRVLCAFCHRPAVGIAGRSHAPVCAEHIPGTPEARRAARLVRWAGGDWIALRDRVFSAVKLVRRTASDEELESLRRTIRTEAMTRDWWSRQPELELPIRIRAHQIVEEEYRAWVKEQRANGGRRGGVFGGGPKTVSRNALAKAAAMVRKGVAIRAAARKYCLSEATLRRYLIAMKQS